MDSNISRIADYVHAFKYSDVPASVVHDCKRRVLDTLGVALAAYHAEPSAIARRLAERVSDPKGASVIGTTHRALPELATFANGVMMRYLDGNDTYPGGGGHPSDMLAAVFAIADVTKADGKSVIAATVLAYEIYSSLFQAACMRDHGMDHAFYTAVGSAVAAAKLMGLTRDRIAQAVALAITPNLASRPGTDFPPGDVTSDIVFGAVGVKRDLRPVQHSQQFALVRMQRFQQPVERGEASPAKENAIEPGAQRDGAALAGAFAVGLEIGIVIPDQAANPGLARHLRAVLANTH